MNGEALAPEVARSAFGPRAWHASELAEDTGRVTLPEAVQAELTAVIAYLRCNPFPTIALRTDDFELTATREFGRRLRVELDEGCGFVLVDALPVGAWDRAEQGAAYWLLGAAVARPVAQSFDGKLIYDVRDLGRPPGNGVRPDVTNAGQNFHTDNSYNHTPPQVVGLLCLQTAKSGGTSAIVNFAWAYQQMRSRHPALLQRLHQPFYFDRQKEHAPHEVPVTQHPLFEHRDGRLVARLSLRQVANGQRIAGVALDAEGRAALAALEAILETPGAAKTFEFAPGQIQFLNNHALGHRRSAFVDHAEGDRKRHLVRLWLRDGGRPGYNG